MIFRKVFVYQKYPEQLKKLYELACNIWCLWNYDAVGLFYRMDSSLFREVDHNPLKFLNSLSYERLETLAEDKGFLFELDKVWNRFREYMEYQGQLDMEILGDVKMAKDEVIAYFSMEYGLHECIRIYAGGLGVLSGDYLKGCSDLGLPVVGIGLLYKYGYFTQHIDMNGYQQEVFSKFENHLIPIKELHDSEGNWAYINVRIGSEDAKIKLWRIDVGKSMLILLDTDIEENPARIRDITSELYVTNREKRLQQELVLGVGGFRALESLGINTRIYHFNEGHSAFAILGRLAKLMGEKKFSFSEAKEIIRTTTVFTTHTPVIAGNENFDTELVKKYLLPKIKSIGLSFEQFARYGYVQNNSNIFWLPAFAMHFSKYINGVSKQHTQISRQMWSGIFEQMPVVEIPMSSVTNGVHLSWISSPFTDMFNRYLGPDYIHCRKNDRIWDKIYNIPDEEFWEEHRRNKRDMINFIRREFGRQVVKRPYSHAKGSKGGLSFNTDYLTIVFARRFAAYKRPTLILKDKKRLVKILRNSTKPVQMIFSGKAHPADQQSKEMIKEIIDFSREYNVEDRVIFLEDYDMNIARHLCWGADIWLNNPSVDMEASGTSGMKAAMNGVLQLSTLEGWWAEGYDGKNGWAIRAGRGYHQPELRQIADAEELYDLLEHQITELYYDRNEADIPVEWITMMKNTVYSVCRNFNINRAICDYLKKMYKQSLEDYQRVSSDDYKLLRDANREEQDVLNSWDMIELTSFSTNIEKKDHLSESEEVFVELGVSFGQAKSELFKAELFYIYQSDTAYRVFEMELDRVIEKVSYFTCKLKIEGYGIQSFNVRVRPANDIVADIHPELIKWKS